MAGAIRRRGNKILHSNLTNGVPSRLFMIANMVSGVHVDNSLEPLFRVPVRG